MHVRQKLGQLPVQCNVLLFNRYPAGHDVHWDKLFGLQVKQLEDGLQDRHVDPFRKALL